MKDKKRKYILMIILLGVLMLLSGYGIQETGGYSISVEDCDLSDTAICVKTRLQGPENGEEVTKAPSYPFIVLKLELREEEVLFQ